MENLPFTPIQDRVIVEKDPRERLLSSGLIIPHVDDPERQVADERDVAKVLGTGPGKILANGQRRLMSVETGDRVVFGRNKGQMIRYMGRDFCVLLEEHVIGKLQEDDVFVPLGGYIVAESVSNARITEAGVIIPEGDSERDEAYVHSIGPGAIRDDGTREEMVVKRGDLILYNPRMAEPFVCKGKQYIAMRQEHIVCVTNRDPPSRTLN